MADDKAATFEVSLKRLEEIVHQLEGDTVSLDRSVELFQEGRDLARHCETLLKGAQETIDAAVAGRAPDKKPDVPSPDVETEIDEDIPF